MHNSNRIFIPPLILRDHRRRTLLQTSPLLIPSTASLAVTGPSGAGKSLFLKSLFGWAAPDARPVFTKEMGACLMVQDPSQGLTPGLSLAGHFREMGKHGAWRSLATGLLKELGLDDPGFLGSSPARLSGGERQRVMLALILMKRPRILVCDEPAASLDARNERALWKIFEDLRRSRGLGLIFATHRMDLIERHADYVLILENGRDVFFDSRRAFFGAPRQAYQEKLLRIYRSRSSRGEQIPTRPLSSTPKPSLFELRGLSRSLGPFKLCENFSWRLNAGEWWWWTGPSGSGKTSLARIVAGLTRETPSEKGRMRFQNRELAPRLQKRGKATRQAIQYLFQHGTMALNPALKVNAQLGRAFRADRGRLNYFLQRLGLDHLDLDHRPAAFSMGEIQRLNIIRALASRPALLICDEFLSPLDPARQQDLLEFLEEWRSREGFALVIITHDPNHMALMPGLELHFPLLPNLR